ncbi:hypothetical protein [Pedobacter sp. ASV28]|jgi:hypothetical protein|uniref:hypothetical protein n=1 Tax=Pedobacter sp. ASV28 TaxID=2795123 RepID=UPI0018EBF289|nr:hypothetical protein [Pedobacter sp. ASV28]
MEKYDIIELLEIIDQQVSSSILGGREEDYEELEGLGYIKIDRHSVQWAASITPLGLDYLEQNR